MNVLDLFAKLSLDSSEYDKGLEGAKSKASSIGGAISGGLKTMAKVGVAAIGAATGAISAFAGSAIKEGMSFDKAMSQVYATMGDKADVLIEDGVYKGQKASEALRDFAMEMGRTTRYTAEQSAEALNYMALAGYDAATSMQMLPNVMSLAAAGDFDLARASDMLTDSQTAFGISLERTTLMVDEMAKAASTGNTSVEQLGDAFLVVGGLAQELNGGFVTTASGATLATDGIQELEIALTAMANAGVKGSEAGTHMRNMLLKLSDPTDKGTQALERMGVTIFDKTTGAMRSLTDIMGDLQMQLGAMTQEDKIGVISALFNTRDMAAAEALLGAVEQKYVKIGDDLVDMATAYEQYGDAIYDSSQGFEIVQSSWDQIGEQILDSKIKLDDVTQAITDSGFEWEKYGRTAQSSIDKLSGDIRNDLLSANMSVEETAADIAEAYDISFSDAMKAVRGVKTAIDETTGAAETMADTQMDNLWGSIEYFKSALSGAKIIISDELTPDLRSFIDFGTDGITKIADAFQSGGLTGAMGAFGEVLSEGLNMVIDLLPEAINAGMQLLGAFGQGLLDNLPTIVDAAVQIVVQLSNGLVQALPELARGAITLIKSLGESFKNNSSELMSVGSELLTMLWDGITEGLPMLVQGAVELMGNFATYLQEAIPQILPVALNALMEFSGSLRENAGLLVDGALNLIKTLAQGLIDNLPVMIQTIPTIVSNIAGIINDNAPKLIATGIELIGDLVIGIVEAIPTIIAEFPKIVKAIFDVLMAVNWIQLGGSIITGIGNGIKALAHDLPTTLKNIGTQAVEWLKTIQWSTLGRDIIDLIVIGIKALMNAIPNMLRTIARSAVATFKSINWGELGWHLITGIVSGIGNAAHLFMEAIGNLAKKAWESITDFFKVESPSKRMMWVGEMLDAGLAKGINNMAYMVDDAMQDLSAGVMEVTPQLALADGGTVSDMSGTGYNQVVNIYSPTALDPSETARQTRNATRDMILQLRGKR